MRDTGIELERMENRGRAGMCAEKWAENVENTLEMDGKFEIHPEINVISKEIKIDMFQNLC